MNEPRTRIATTTFCLAAALLAASAARADDYDDARAQAAALGAAGDLAGASAALRARIDAYPQDWVIAAEFAAIEYQRKNYETAARAYRVALARAPEAREPARGLAWSLARAGHCDDALPWFREVSRRDPADEDAKAGIAACSPASTASMAIAPTTIAVGAHAAFFSGHPWKQAGYGADLVASTLLGRHAWLAGAYEYTRYTTLATSGVSAFDHHDVFAHAGWVSPSFDAILQGGLLVDASRSSLSKHAGVSLRASLWGDLFLNGSISAYDSITIGRIEALYRAPLTRWLSVVPGVALQTPGYEVLVSGSLDVAVELPFASLWVGGKLGDELYGAHLGRFYVDDSGDRVAWGVHAGARVPLVRHVAIGATWSLDHFKSAFAPIPYEGSVHALSLGPVFTF